NYASELARSADHADVVALYRSAGLNLTADLATLNRAPRIHADPSAAAYLHATSDLTGHLRVPVLTLHAIATASLRSKTSKPTRRPQASPQPPPSSASSTPAAPATAPSPRPSASSPSKPSNAASPPATGPSQTQPPSTTPRPRSDQHSMSSPKS